MHPRAVSPRTKNRKQGLTQTDLACYTSVEFISAERTTESYKLLPIGAAPTESYVLQAEPWLQNPHTLGHEFVSAVEILQNWLQQHRRDLGRRSSETHSVVD
jgi:hypothetical protein